MNESNLLRLKQQIEKAKTTISELSGRKQYLMKQLKDNWECSSVEEAKEKMAILSNEIEELNLKIESGIQELEEKYQL
jgi:uncharacterized protein YukE